jgi:chromosome partitioning protein
MGQIITFAQQKGGAGKTTVLAHLAAAWAADGRRVALVDLDPQKSLTRWATLRADPALELVDSSDYRAASDLRAAAHHDLVLVDCPGAASTLLDAALRESTLVIAPCQPSALDAWATQRSARRPSASARPSASCSTASRRAAPRSRRCSQRSGRATLLLGLPRQPRRLLQALLTGRTAPEIARRSVAADEIAALRAEIDGLLADALAA